MDKGEFERILRENQDKLPPEMRLSDADIANAVRIAEGVDFVAGLIFKRSKPKNPLEDLLGRFDADSLIREVFSKTDFVAKVKKSVWDEVTEPVVDGLETANCSAVSTKPDVPHAEHPWWDPIERMAEGKPANRRCPGVTREEAVAWTRLQERLKETAEGDEVLTKMVGEDALSRLALSDTTEAFRHVVATWGTQNKISVVNDTVTCLVCWSLLSPSAHGMVEHRKVCKSE